MESSPLRTPCSAQTTHDIHSSGIDEAFTRLHLSLVRHGGDALSARKSKHNVYIDASIADDDLSFLEQDQHILEALPRSFHHSREFILPRKPLDSS
ncbi:unnamed protein product [Fusarium graminearum]|uniref:Chromosome 3, complete genome n=1 Tax=Gibberella zeae (strain ATCC MYA-4620 / CBS 123657 / FGSC 9075 / NRRL 31084 / PH-1) TaxID=229533 RepID=A0A098DY65_GIBZE|nr:unnamed protein product [Fusarium graminearum]